MVRKTFTIISLFAFSLSMLARPVMAEFITTEQAVNIKSLVDERGAVRSFLARADVQAMLVSKGVDPTEAILRVGALSDQEINSLYGAIGDLPAGGGDFGTFVGAALIVFFVLLLTDIFGLTKVYSFTRSVR